jgi:hypothetical protein
MNPANFTDQPLFLRMYLTIKTVAFGDNVLPVLSPVSQTAAFADNVQPVVSPTLQMAAFADTILLPVLPQFFTDGWGQQW